MSGVVLRRTFSVRAKRNQETRNLAVTALDLRLVAVLSFKLFEGSLGDAPALFGSLDVEKPQCR